MAEPTDAAGDVQAPQTEQTPQNTNTEPTQGTEPTQAPDMHGFTSEQLADIDKFFKANGGFDSIKRKISNPEPEQVTAQTLSEAPQTPSESRNDSQPTSQPTAPYKAPEGSISAQEFLAKQYFQSLAGEEKYAAISKEIANGDVLKEMATFNIQPLNQDGSINDAMVRRYLDLKAQTVPAQTTSTEPNASPAPTVDYVEVGDKIETIDQAYKVLQQDAQLKTMGQAGHPEIAKAEEFIKTMLGGEKPEGKNPKKA